MTTSKATASNPYHHGDLKNTLILAAAELIEERGSIDFTMSEAARRAGVSSGAPYRHFKDKEDLLARVAELGFIGLHSAINHAIEPHPRGSIDRIISSGHAYMRYVTEKAAFFDLMWGEVLIDTLENAQFTTLGAFNELVDLVDDWVKAEQLTTEPRELAVKLMAMGHGLVSLQMTKRLNRLAPNLCIFQCLTDSAYTFLQGIKEEQTKRRG
ncbi:TetR/AcrR family transcriptional regulator [Aequoribacter sp.]|jgi:AcrR family transcriptional regulator|uniref:TetR/AcrR family transcriptional regulator n=1 Tax=Aequoribacter sp. TaxID=2847771 RepID=UPI003F6A237B